MIFPLYEYVDCAFGGVNKRNNIKKISEIKIPAKSDCYRTYFRFTEEYKNYFDKRKSVMGFHGKCYADFIPIDIDDTDLSNAYEKAKVILNILEFDFDFSARHIFFSGSKGFHIYLPSVSFGTFQPSEHLPKIFRDIVLDIVGKEIEVDTKNYDINRLFRLNNTVNSKTGLYKIGIEYSEFEQGMVYILEIAKKSRTVAQPSIIDYVVNSQFVELYQKHRVVKKDNILTKIKDGVPEGERDDTAIKIVGVLRKAGHDKEFTATILHGWNKGLDEPLTEAEIDKCINSGYRYEDNNLECDIKPVWSVSDEYKDYVNSTKKINIGVNFIDTRIRGLRPGQVLTIMGFTGNFKSSLLQWIMRHYYKYSKEPVLIFEMEMSNLDMFERAMQMATDKSGKEIENIYKSNGDASALFKALKEDQEKFLIVDRPALSFEDMKEYLILAEKMLKEKIGLIGIDFLQLMQSMGQTSIQKMDTVAKGLKTFAKDMNVPIIAISQVTGVEDEYEKISLMDSRDSKTIAQMSDYAIGIRMKKGEDDVQILDLLKNRKGNKGSCELRINRDSLKFSDTPF